MRNLLIDDMRNPGEGIIPTDCVVARDYWTGLGAIIHCGPWDTLYLDHDLGCFHEGKELTGYSILCELEMCYAHVWPELLPQQIILVTSNPVGRARMEQVIRKLYEEV